MMATKSKLGFKTWLNVSVQRVSVMHFLFLVGYAAQTIVMDSANVMTLELVMQRWFAAAGLLIVASMIWYLAHNQNNSVATYKRLIFTLVLSDIAFASFNTYTDRGMASRAGLLFALAIAVSAVLLSRAALFTTALISTAAYIAASVAYFTINFNEGYGAELYGVVLFSSFCYFILAGLLSVLVRFGGETANS